MDRTEPRSDFTDEPPPPACLTAALAYLARGWSPIPLCPPDHSGHLPANHRERCTCIGKTPVITWGQYRNDRMTPAQLRYQWRKNPAFNVGVIMGSISGMVAFDIDGEAGEAELVRLIGPVPPTWEFSTGWGAGRRLLFGLPPGASGERTRYRLNGAPLDYLAYGSQTVMPPSLHRNGLVYRWVHGWEADDTPLAPFTDAMRQAVLRSPGQQTTTRPPRASATGPGQQLRRAREDARTWEPAVQGQGGHSRVFKLACRLVHGYGLDDGQALAVLLDEWNPRCDPPWGEEELRKEVEGARERGRYDPIPERPMTDKSTRDSAHHNNGQAGSATPPPDPPPSPPKRKIGRPLSERAAPPLDWLYHPYVPREMLTLLVGPTASGKSTLLAFFMSRARRSVLLAGSEEDPERMMRPRIIAHGGDPDSILVIDSSEWKPPQSRDILIDAIREHGADLLCIDPCDSFFPDGSSQNDETHVRRFLEAFTDIARRTGCAVVGVRHPGKGDNLMVNSRAWREVPRSVVELVVDPGPPVQRVIRPHKDSNGQDAAPRKYDLVGERGKPRVFTLGELVDPIDVAELAEAARPGEVSKIKRALKLIPQLLAQGRMPAKAVLAKGLEEGISPEAMYRAAARLGVKHPRDGFGTEHTAYWELPPGGGSAK